MSSTMDSSLSHIIFIHKDLRNETLVPARSNASVLSNPDLEPESCLIADSLQPLLEYSDVHTCSTGASCIATLIKLLERNVDHLTPLIVLIDTPYDEPVPERKFILGSSTTEYTRETSIQTPDEEVYGLKLLQRIMTEAHLRSMSKLVVAIPVISYPNGPLSPYAQSHLEFPSQPINTSEWIDKRLLQRSLDLGATDVIVGPIDRKSVTSLEVHAYRAHRDALREHRAVMEIRRGRKRSWVGYNEEKPYSYLREAMVSGLMKGICRDGQEEDITQAKISVPADRRYVVAQAIGQWNFSAHTFSDDELLYAGLLIFKHALDMPGMDKWRIGTDQLINYLVACRAAYNSFVPYHNWRHVVDVLQATFSFLVVLGCLPPYPRSEADSTPVEKTPFTALIEPFEAITLLITAIGHDVGHPGVNNGFLVTLNAPLAQLYNDKSVLESFHCAAYSQILRRYWYSAFEDVAMRKLMISSILATDMGLHSVYMKKLADVTKLLKASNNTTDWTPKQISDHKELACSLIIKCADICNVAREYSTAVQWMCILSREFSRQATMEKELQIKTSLMSPPKNDMQSLCNGQLGFMKLFAIPLFTEISAIMPQMSFTVVQLDKNKLMFEEFTHNASRLPLDQQSTAIHIINNEVDDQNDDDVPRMTFDDSTVEPPSPVEHDQVMGLSLSRGRDVASRLSTLTLDPMPVSTSTISPRGRGISTSSSNHDHEIRFSSVTDFAASDLFSSNKLQECPGAGLISASTQRNSETIEDSSTSGPSSNDWASQANSATGKLPLSPSTRGTSINSQSDIHEEAPPPDIPVHIIYPEDTATPTPSNMNSYSQSPDEHQPSSRGNSIGRAEGKALTKRSSRFRLNTFNFFKRNKSPPPIPVANVDHIS